MSRWGTVLLILLIYALGIGAAVFYSTVMGAGDGIVSAVAIGLAIHAVIYFGRMYRASRKPN